MADSYRSPLWAAAYVINGGCSDDGFENFRSRLITQGRQVYERTVADPDTLADLPVIQAKAPRTWPVECEDTLRITSEAYLGRDRRGIPPRRLMIRYPELDPAWDFDFDDQTEMTRRLPRLTAACTARNQVITQQGRAIEELWGR
jgi:hypothetical protein